MIGVAEWTWFHKNAALRIMYRAIDVVQVGILTQWNAWNSESGWDALSGINIMDWRNQRMERKSQCIKPSLQVEHLLIDSLAVQSVVSAPVWLHSCYLICPGICSLPQWSEWTIQWGPNWVGAERLQSSHEETILNLVHGDLRNHWDFTNSV